MCELPHKGASLADRYVASGSGTADRFRIQVELLALLALSAVLFLLNTRHGIGILPDSTRYMQLVSTPYDAPLYPWLLNAGSLLGFDLEQAALGLGFVLYGLNTFLVFHLFHHAIRNQPLLVIIGTLLVIVSPTFLWVNTIAMSEALFVALMLLAVRFFVAYMDRLDRRFLVASSVSVGFAMLARFVAPPLGAAFAAIALFSNSRRRPAKASYRRRNSLRRERRHLSVVGGGQQDFGRSGRRTSNLVLRKSRRRPLDWRSVRIRELPASQPRFLNSFVFRQFLRSIIGALVIVAQAVRRNWLASRPREQDILILIFGLFAIFYVLFIILSVLVEANLLLNSRYSLPLYISFVFIFVVSAANYRSRAGTTRITNRLIISAFLLLLALNGLRSAVQTSEAYNEGIGFQSLAWQTSPIVMAVRALPADAKIYTNASDPLNFLTRRWTDWIPAHSAPRTGQESNEGPFEEQIRTLRRVLVEQGGYVVFVDAIDWRFYLATEDELVKLAKLKLVRSETDGRIYQAETTGGEQGAGGASK